MAKTQSVKVELNAVDRATRVFQKVGKEADALRGKISGISTGLSGALSGVGAGALGGVVGGLALGGTVQSAAAFEKQLFNLTNVTSEDTAKIKKDMEGLSSTLGSVTALTEGYYQILSAGVSDAAQGMELLTTASQLAAVSGTSQAESINALTKMMAGFRGEIKSTTEAADLLLDIEEYGQTSVRELIPVIGDLAGTSEIAGIKSRELAAGLALITQTAGSTSQAATQFAALANELIKPNEQLAKLIASLGAKSGRELLEKNGLIGALSLLQQAARASGKEMANFLGSQESIKAFGALAANNFSTVSGILENVGTKANRTQKAFERYSETFEGIQAAGLNAAENLAVAFGEGLLPIAKQGVKALTEGMNESRETAKKFGEEVGNTLSGLMAIVNSIPADAHIAAAGGIVGFRLFGPAGALIGIIPGILSGLGEVLGMMQKMAGFEGIDLGAVDPEDFDLTTAEGAKDYYEAVSKSAQKGLQKRLDTLVEEHSKATATAADVPAGAPAGSGLSLPSLPSGYKPVADSSKKKTDAAKEAAKVAREEAKNLELVAEVMAELEQKTGQYGLSIDYTNKLIEQQAALWLKAGVPQEYVDQLKEIRQLEASREGWAGAMLATQEYYSEATNMAEAYKGVVTNAFGGMEDAIVNACMTGKLSFSDMVNGMIADLMRLMVRQSITGPLANALGQGIAGLFAGNQYGGAYASGVVQTVPRGALYGPSALGNVFSGAGSLHSYSNSIVSRPTMFTAASRLPQYASGAGLMGEAGPEAIMPLTRMGNGRLGVEARGWGGKEPTVNVNIVNSTGQPAETRTRSDNNGNKTIDVYVGDMAAKQMATPGSTLNRAVSAQTGTRRPAIKR